MYLICKYDEHEVLKLAFRGKIYMTFSYTSGGRTNSLLPAMLSRLYIVCVCVTNFSYI